MNLENIKPGPSFKPWGVRALKAGAKTQTRRKVPLPPCEYPYAFYGRADEDIAEKREDVEPGDWLWGEADYPDEGTFVLNPNYQPGEIYYVREPLEKTIEPNPRKADPDYEGPSEVPMPQYVADGTTLIGPWQWEHDNLPAIFMPGEAARLFVRITDVWHEPFGKISPEDAIAEGVEYHPGWDNTPDLRDRYSLVDADKYFNEIIMPGIHGDDLPEHLVAYEFEVLDRDDIREL